MRPRLLWIVPVALATMVTGGPSLRATPALGGFMSKPMAFATFEDIAVNLHTINDSWQLQLNTHGQTDMYVQANFWPPQSSTGWHTHPGPSLVVITSGTVTAYDSDDPSCTPHIYSALPGPYPNHFVDSGGGHVHIVRNEDPSIQALGMAVQLIPQGGTRRIDAPAPSACSSIQ